MHHLYFNSMCFAYNHDVLQMEQEIIPMYVNIHINPSNSYVNTKMYMFNEHPCFVVPHLVVYNE